MGRNEQQTRFSLSDRQRIRLYRSALDKAGCEWSSSWRVSTVRPERALAVRPRRLRKMVSFDRAGGDMATIYKRGKTWWARAQRDNKEFRKSLATRDRPTAEKRLRIWLDELDATGWGGRARIPFGTAARA